MEYAKIIKFTLNHYEVKYYDDAGKERDWDEYMEGPIRAEINAYIGDLNFTKTPNVILPSNYRSEITSVDVLRVWYNVYFTAEPQCTLYDKLTESELQLYFIV
jgi:hypothetical protein